jgi:hypothetical protein
MSKTSVRWASPLLRKAKPIHHISIHSLATLCDCVRMSHDLRHASIPHGAMRDGTPQPRSLTSSLPRKGAVSKERTNLPGPRRGSYRQYRFRVDIPRARAPRWPTAATNPEMHLTSLHPISAGRMRTMNWGFMSTIIADHMAAGLDEYALSHHRSRICSIYAGGDASSPSC